MLRNALAFCGGTAAIHALPSAGAAWAAAIPAVAAVLFFRIRPAFAAFLAGCAMALQAATSALEHAWPCTRDREEVLLEGRIAAPAVERADRTDFDLDISGMPDGLLLPDRVRLSWYEADVLLRAGERWRFRARLRCPRGFANPGAPDRELALLRDRIGATGYVTAATAAESLAEDGASKGIRSLRERVAESIVQALGPGPSTSVLQGLAVGLRSSIPDSLWEAFAATGLAHLVAISGLHVTGCALAALMLLRSAWRCRLLPATPRRPAAESALVVVVTAAYVMLSGASLPALRTVAMVALFHALRTLRRHVTPGETLALCAAILVAADPLAVTSAGFWLSFVATAALLATGSAGAGWQGRASQFARAQVAVTVLLTPVLAATFGRLSVVSPFLNALAIPAFSILVLPAVLLGTSLALVAPALAGPIWQLVSIGLDATWPVLERIAAWPAASFAPASQSPALVAGTAILALLALVVPLAGLRVAACVALIALAAGRSEPVPHGTFMLTVVDVGQGLSAVVETARHVLVFDTGPRWRAGTVAARVSLVPYLRARGVRRIDRLVLSHDDADHAGGAEAVGVAFELGERLAPPGGGIAADLPCVAGGSWRWDGVDFRLLHPADGFEGSDNERSCVIHVRAPGGSVLLLADPEAAAEAALAARPVAADVVLIPHHGSATSSSPALVAAVSARVGIVSAGFANRWGMPREEIVARWRAAGTTVLGTAGDGAVRVRFPVHGARLEIDAERRDRRHWWRGGSGG
jgi:competence protein ComEC